GAEGSSPQTLTLSGNILTVAAAGKGGASRLVAIVTDAVRPPAARRLVWLKKQGGQLGVDREQALHSEDYAFDVCDLSGTAEVLTLRPTGVYRLGSAAPVAATDTLFAQPSDEAMPRVRICQQLE
ncbi:hypothetical protein, partial [Glaesserella parasuis]|uniref:hypothetical protein n=1 Tax=Glaesserella parasuis TaxID=738 RepID=UPI003F3BBF0E